MKISGASEASKYIKAGKSIATKLISLKVLERGSSTPRTFKFNELQIDRAERREGRINYFNASETNVFNEAEKTFTTDIAIDLQIHDLEDYYVPGTLKAVVYDENNQAIAEQPIDELSDEERATLAKEREEVEKIQNEKEQSDKLNEIVYKRKFNIKNVPIANKYRVEIHGKYNRTAYNSLTGRREETVQEGILQMKFRRNIGAVQSPIVDAKLNLTPTTRVGIEGFQAFRKNENDEWEESNFVQKGDEIKLELLIRGNMQAGSHITSATINNQDVELATTEGKVDVYETVIKAPEKTGEFDITITKIGLNTQDYKFTKNGIEYILAKYSLNVLSNKPEIENFKLNYDENLNANATFNIKEEVKENQTTSNSIKNARINLYEYDTPDTNYGDKTPSKTYKLQETSGKINLNQNIKLDGIERSKKYWLEIRADYSLIPEEAEKELPEVASAFSEADEVTEFKDKVLYSSPFMIQADDNIHLTNLKVEKDKLEKNEEIMLRFNFDASGDEDFLKPKQLKVEGNDTLFDIVAEENNTYRVNTTGYSVSGEQTIKLTQLILNTGKVIRLDDNENHKAKITVYKDKPGVKDFAFNETTEEIEVAIKDREETLSSDSDKVQFELYEDDSNKQVADIKTESVPNSLEYKVKFTPNKDVKKYRFIVKAKYSRFDEDEPSTEEIYSSEFSLNDRTIEIKDITNIDIVKFENGVTTNVEGLTYEELQNGEQYLLRVSMANASTFYSDINYYEKTEDGKLILTLNYVGARQYNDDKAGSITVKLEDSHTTVNYNGQNCIYYVSKDSFTGLMYLLRNNPEIEVSLETDYDASSYAGPIDDNIYINKSFSGKIHGNGYTIKNLTMPLFNELVGGEIDNLNIAQPTLSADKDDTNYGLIARRASGAHLKGLTITDATMRLKNRNGGLFGEAKDNTIIEECELRNLNISYNQSLCLYVGGMVGILSNSTIQNCKIQGTMGSGWTWHSQAGIAASAGSGSIIRKCVADIDVTSYYGTDYSTAGLVADGDNTLTIQDCANISDGGNGSPTLYPSTAYNKSASGNVYGNSAKTQKRLEADGFYYQSIENFTQSFYKDTLKLDENIWNLEGCGKTVLPKLIKHGKMSTPTTEDIEIPSYDRIKESSDYDSSKEIAYHNLSKLAPYYDAKYIVEDAKQINATEDINKKIIQGILPFDNQGKIVNSLTSDTYQNIARIELIFKDKTIAKYDVDFESYYGNVVCYNIPALHNIKYNFKNYVINKDAKVVKELTEYIENMSYVSSIDTLSKAKDGRLYEETFDDSSVVEDKKYSKIFNEKTVKQEAEQVVINLLSNNNYNITNDDIKTASVIKNELISTNKLGKYLFTYTYFKRWYDIDIGNYNLKDILLYHDDIFTDTINYDVLTTLLFVNDTNMSTSRTADFYNGNIGKSLGLNTLGDFMDYFINATGEYTDVNDWFVNNFNGIVHEEKLPNQDDRLRYRAWDYLKCWQNIILPLLRTPDYSAYVFSCPTQVHVGATRTYVADPTTTQAQESIKKRLESFGKAINKNYETIYGMLGGGGTESQKEEAIKLLNAKNDLQTDTNNAYVGETINGKYLTRRTWQTANKTLEDYHKWFAEATGIWTTKIGSAAYAYGTRIYWEDNSLIGDFVTWSHETMHNQDGALICKSNNRRPGVGGELFSNGFLTQGADSVGFCKFNFCSDYDSSTSHTVNWTRDRISSPEKVRDYYDKAFQLNYFLDYMIAQALFELDTDEQERVLSKLGDTDISISRAGSNFERVNTIDDLIEGQYAIDYSAEGYRNIRWFNPMSDKDFTSIDNLWTLSYEMLGYAGYDDGWIPWTTDIVQKEKGYENCSDQNVLAYVTKTKTGKAMNIKEYKKARFAEAAQNANKVSYMKFEDIKNQFKETLKADAASNTLTKELILTSPETAELKIKLFNKFKRYTDDLRSTPFGNDVNNSEVEVRSGKEFIDAAVKNPAATIKLMSDIDFSEYTEGTSMIRSTFAGTIEGNGKKITGITIPIFENTLNATINNLNIEGAQIQLAKTNLGALANTIENTKITKVKITDSSINSEGKDTVGALVGQVLDSTIQECSVEKTSVSGAKNVGGLVGNLTGSGTTKEDAQTVIKDSYTHKGTVSGTTKVGGLIGNIEKYSKVEKSSALDVNVTSTQDSIGGFVGEINKGIIENCYATGTVTGSRSYCGGFVGYTTDPEIRNCYTTVTLKEISNLGGFVGTVRNTGIMENCISLAIMENSSAAKFITGTNTEIIKNGFKNNYEITEFIGKSANATCKAPVESIAEIAYNGSSETLSSGGSSTGRLNGLNESIFWNHKGNAANRDYGVDFDETIWNIPSEEDLAQGKLPTLKGKGNPEGTTVTKPKRPEEVTGDPVTSESPAAEILSIKEDDETEQITKDPITPKTSATPTQANSSPSASPSSSALPSASAECSSSPTASSGSSTTPPTSAGTATNNINGEVTAKEALSPSPTARSKGNTITKNTKK